jgi:putative transposase
MAERKPYLTDLTDAQWILIASELPPEKHGGRHREVDLREVVNTILYQARTGCQWAMLPHDLLPKSTVWDYFKGWQKDGTWQKLLDKLRRQVRIDAGRESDPSAACIDTQTVPTHHQGADSSKDGFKLIKGRKRHIVVDTLGLLLAVAVTAGADHDGRTAPAVLGKLDAQTKRRLEAIFADGKYQGQFLPDWIAQQGDSYRIEVVDKAEGQGFIPVPIRWVVERTYAWLGYSRRLSKDYERTTSSSEAWVQVSSIHLLLKRATNQKQKYKFNYRLNTEITLPA